MGDSSQAPSALEAEARAAVDEALARVGVDRSETPPAVLERLEARARIPDQRLVVGRYLVTGELGRGGMGVVYEAWDPGIERRVAIKTIEPDLVPEDERDEVVERFRRETKVVGRLHHPSIVTIFDSGSERDPVLYYYVMEYLEGQSLARVLRERHMLSEAEAVRIARDIAEALALSHRAGIIHRDIKPSNIFLRDNLQAVLLDFGIAKTGSVNLTRQGQILGTPSYLAPERLREKEEPIDGRADIFSLGVLLFTMLTGEAPFVGEDVYEVIDKIAKENHPQLERSTPVGQALSAVIDRMLAKDPNDRYPSAADAARALEAVLRMLSGERPTSIVPEHLLPDVGNVDVVALEEMTPADDEDDTGRLDHPSEQTTAPKAPISGPAPIPDLRVRPPADLEEEDNVLKKTMVSAPPPEAIEGFGQEETAEELPAQKRPPDQGPTELLPKAKTEENVRVADVLGTRPELALQRETRELTKGEKRRAPTVLDPDDEPPPEPTSPSIPSFIAPAKHGYRAHGAENDESTDDETLADPSGKIAAAYSAHAAEQRESNGVVRASAEEVATEQLVRAERRDNERASRPPLARARRSRIEASLVDEDDVVVKPAPLDDLKPDELPTQAGVHPPEADPPQEVTATAATSNPEVVRARGDSRVLDPAEAIGDATQGGALVSDKDEDDKKSAVVGRRTIGPARARPASAAAAAAIQVRVSGRAFASSQEDRVRMLRRRGVMLLAGALASVGIGLMLGRMQRENVASEELTAETEAPSPKIEPRASVRNILGADQIELARPRPPSELIADAEAAQTAGQLDDAQRLFQKAIDSTQEGAPLRARARLGLADVTRAKGDTREAIVQYRALIKLYPSLKEAQQAKVALAELGVPYLEPQRRSRPAPVESPAPPPSKAEQVAKKDVIFKPDDAMTAEEMCEVLKRRHLQNAAEAVDAFEEMRRRHPNAACVFWNLGRKYEQLGRNRQALAAYRRYIELDPQASQRETIEKKKIPNLEAKLRQ